MKTAAILLVLLPLSARSVTAQSPLDDAEEGRADLSELLHLSGGFWNKLMGKEPESNGFDSAAALFRRYEVAPQIGGVVSGSGIGFGLTHTLWHDSRSSIRWNALATTKGYSELGLIHETSLGNPDRYRLRSGVLYRDLAQEDFFGLGLDSRASDRTDYRLRETDVATELGIALSSTVGLRLGADVRNIRTGSGENRALPSPELRFSPASISGYGDRFLYASFGAALSWDTRDAPAYPRRGSFVEGEIRQFLGLGENDPGFRRFSIELQNALPLPGHDHSLVTRVHGEWLDHGGDTAVPFFFTRGLGGSHSLRSFPLNRFRGEDLLLATVEYRSAILPGKLDGVVFWDAGGVYGNLRDFQLVGLQHSFGAGIRVLRKDRVLLRLEVAQGAEGARFLVSFSPMF